MTRIPRGSRAATTATGHEKLDELLGLLGDVEKFIPDADLMDGLAVLGAIEKIVREVGEEVEDHSDEAYRRLQDVVEDYLRDVADEDDLRRVFSENGSKVPA
jgi:hypothetical protein